jgi:folate-dependent tRNA-U54 methylase TrmFO/GidA
MNANYGLFPPIDVRAKGRERRRALAARALRDGDQWLAELGLSDQLGEGRAAEV